MSEIRSVPIADRLTSGQPTVAGECRMAAQSAAALSAAGDSGGRRKKRWSELSTWQQRAIVLGGIAELVMTTFALRDLARRPRRQVRGWKPMWLLACVVQPVGPILYLVAGRRRSGV